MTNTPLRDTCCGQGCGFHAFRTVLEEAVVAARTHYGNQKQHDGRMNGGYVYGLPFAAEAVQEQFPDEFAAFVDSLKEEFSTVELVTDWPHGDMRCGLKFWHVDAPRPPA